MGDPDDRRRSPRTPVLLKVDYRDQRGLLSDYLTDLAGGGLYIHTESQFELNETINFSISFPGLLEPIDLEGVVRWQARPSDGEKNPGIGVQFVFKDEATKGRIASLVGQLEPSDPPTSSEGHEPFCVLLVEDNPFVHDLFKHAVQRFHRENQAMGELEIFGAGNGQEAWEHLTQHNVDLAIIDHFLPVTSGSDLVRRVRADVKFKHIPLLVVSVGGEGVREQALAAGADLFLDKPVLLNQLLSTLRLLVAKRGSIADIFRHMA